MGGALFYRERKDMTIQEIKNRLSEEHPNQYGDDMLIEWINDVERDISEFLRTFDRTIAEPGEQHDELSDDVMVEEKDLYVQYLISRICMANEEYDRYNVHAELYNARLTDWKERYLRAHRPLYKGKVIL